MNQMGVTLFFASIPIFKLAALGEGSSHTYIVALLILILTTLLWLKRCAEYPEKIVEFLVSQKFVDKSERSKLLEGWATKRVSFLHMLPFFIGWFTMSGALLTASIKLT